MGFRLSRFLAVLQVDAGWHLCAHALLGRKRLYGSDAIRWLVRFSEPQSVAGALEEHLGEHPEDLPRREELLAHLEELVEDWRGRSFLVEESNAGSEEAVLAQTFRDAMQEEGPDALAARWSMEDRFVLPGRHQDVKGTPLSGATGRWLLLGWCATQALREVLIDRGRLRGARLEVEIGFTDDLHLVDRLRPDVTVLDLGHRNLLAPLLDAPIDLEAEEAEERLTRSIAFCEEVVSEAAARMGGGLLIVHGIASPQFDPRGLWTAERSFGLRAVHALDDALRAAVGRADDAVFLDEENLLARHGKRWLLDDAEAPSSHHAFPQRTSAARHALLSDAYLDGWEAWRGEGAIRCVVVDLDGTLWPGELADPMFSFSNDAVVEALLYGHHGGLHQALASVRDRGILLVAVSKNEPAQALRRWTELEQSELGTAEHLLRKDDFVSVEISWEDKPDVLERVARELGVEMHAVAFIDDNPLERAAMAHVHPAIWILEEGDLSIRETLLTSPRFQAVHRTRAASQRTETTRARLRRDREAAHAPDRAAFLHSLEVECRVTRALDLGAARRVAELLARTHQLRTTDLSMNPGELLAHAERAGHAVLTMEVADRFASYGLVGVAIVEPSRVRCIAISCRVIGADVHGVLLHHAIAHCRSEGAKSVDIDFVRSDRNAPALRLFELAPFEEADDGRRKRLPAEADTPALPSHCRVSLVPA